MGVIKSTLTCQNCGADVKIRSFRLRSTLKCSSCGQFSDPQALRESIGTLLFFPIMCAAAFSFGWVGNGLGKLLDGPMKLPDLDARLMFLFAFDGVWLTCIWYWCWVGGEHADKVLNHLSAFGLPLLVGIKFGGGQGILVLILSGILNGLLGWAIALPFLISYRRNTSLNSTRSSPESLLS